MAPVLLADIRPPRYSENARRRIPVTSPCDDHCLICGRPVVSADACYVRMTTRGEIVAPDALVSPDDDQGAFPVGPDCARRRELGGLVLSRSPWPGRSSEAGYVAATANLLTGSDAVTYIAAEQGIDADDKYVTVCSEHGEMVSAASTQTAALDRRRPMDWCEQCRRAFRGQTGGERSES